jgi:hemerythrin-like domain-containing protein
MAQPLLGEDGRASVATAVMMSHHAFRRDLANFARALVELREDDVAKADALRAEWGFFRGALHGHHDAEDSRMFPEFAKQSAELASIVENLSSDHRKIDPLLEEGDRAFAELPKVGEAAAVVAQLTELLDTHLTTEEAKVIVPLLRGVYEFGGPASDEEATLYAQGFAWSSHGVASEVLDVVYAFLPESLTSRLPAARAAFETRCERVWGTARAGSSHTSVPEAVVG